MSISIGAWDLWEDAEITAVTRTLISETGQLRRFARQIGNPHAWRIALTTPLLDEKESRALYASITSMRGRLLPFAIKNPWRLLGSGGGNPTVVAGGAFGETQVFLNNLPQNETGIYLPGDFIRFSTTTKVYQIANSVSTDGSGIGELKLSNPVIDMDTIPNGTPAFVGDQLFFTVRLEDDDAPLTLSARRGVYSRHELRLVDHY